ncbi:MAG: ATP-binding protein [Endomicrobium sp.]|jgi:predicted AAA+ superfamily ATPase|nr:ATP-binding protein [Endomicrobium sp.]
MKRTILSKLIEWKNNADKAPLLIEGGRQVGKTWLMQEFGKTAYNNVIYVNFDSADAERLKKIFEPDLNPKRIVEDLEFAFKQKISPTDTLIIFDEIQECNRALVSLKYFCEDAPQYNIVSAGSLLGVALHKNQSFPVGKTHTINLYPMTFTEFLDAIGEERLTEVINNLDFHRIAICKEEIIRNLKYYFYVGGMPRAVLEFIKTKNLNSVREIQMDILNGYKSDFSKHISAVSIPKTSMIWDSLPRQLAKENKRFLYKDMKSGARAAQFEDSLFWLERVGLVYKINRINVPMLPLIAYSQNEIFKLFTIDIGLLSAEANIEISAFTEPNNELFTHYKGSLTEQFVLQELKAANAHIPIYYWANERGIAELDFVIQFQNMIIPIEAKASTNTKARSLKFYMQQFNPQAAIRFSLTDYTKNKNLYDIPLYLISRFAEIIRQ